jgi:hypothetical protein
MPTEEKPKAAAPDLPMVVDTPVRIMTVEKSGPGHPDVRLFDSAAINAAIDKQMLALPKDKTVAAIAYVDREGANVAIVGRIPKVPGEASWTILGTRTWSGDWQASAALRWTI